jgi:hypothetical protein
MKKNLKNNINYFTLLIGITFFFSCNQDSLNESEEETEIIESSSSKSTTMAKVFGAGEAMYSSVQSPDKPTVYTTKYYPATDDAAGINAAIVTANAAGGGTVQLKSMTYQISEQITMKSKVRLLGNGIGATILKRSSSFQTTVSGYFIGADNASLTDVEIRSISVDGDYSRTELAAEPTVLVGIRFASGLGTYNERVRIIYCESKGFTIGIQMSGTTHITVQSSSVHDNGGTYLHHNIYFRRIGHVLIYKNDIFDSVEGSGVKLAGGTTNISNESRYFTVRDNKINNNDRINLNIQGCHHLLIEDNELESQNSSVTAMAGMFLKEYNGYQCRYTDIINNSIIDNTNNGVYVDGCKDFNIEGNSCANNGTDYNISNSTNFTCDYNN